MSETAPNFGSTTLAQVAFVVRDIEEASRRWSEVLGQPLPKVIVTEPGNEVAMTAYGAPSDARCKLAFFSLGPVQLELIEPIGDDSAWARVLHEKGEGFHHLAFWVEGMQKSVDFLRDHGIPMVQRGDMGPGQYAYFDATERLGTHIELLEKTRDARVEP
jgi:Lactoylglutathione lyase and related lyases